MPLVACPPVRIAGSLLAALSALKPAVAHDTMICASATLNRELLVAKLIEKGVRCGQGFQGFLSRPNSRCIKPWPLDNSRRASEQTVVIHHTELSGGAMSGLHLAEILRKTIAELTAIP